MLPARADGKKAGLWSCSALPMGPGHERVMNNATTERDQETWKLFMNLTHHPFSICDFSCNYSGIQNLQGMYVDFPFFPRCDGEFRTGVTQLRCDVDKDGQLWKPEKNSHRRFHRWNILEFISPSDQWEAEMNQASQPKNQLVVEFGCEDECLPDRLHLGWTERCFNLIFRWVFFIRKFYKNSTQN